MAFVTGYTIGTYLGVITTITVFFHESPLMGDT
jgi:hypothetical protein